MIEIGARGALAVMIATTLILNLLAHGKEMPAGRYGAGWALVAIVAEVALIWLAGGWG